MRFYMYLEGAWVEKKAQLMAMSEDAMDETLDTASVQIFFDERQYPYPARTLCKMEHGYYESGVKTEVSYYFIATDAVTIQVLDPRAFKHVLTLVQTTRELSHHALPNMVFTQPRERTASTYFCCENAINVAHYYQEWTSQPTGYYAWKGFTTRSFIVSAGTLDYEARVGTPSPYWLECLPMTTHSQIGKGVIRLKQKAMFVSGTATSPKGEWKDVNRTLAYPSAYFAPRLQVYHHKSDVGKLNNDGQFKDTKSIILSVPITSVTWTDDGGIYELSARDISKINSYTSGYLACEIINYYTGETTDEMADPVSGEFAECLFDRMFVDESEFTSNGIQSVFFYASLEVTYKRATLADVINKIAKRQQCAYDNSINDTLFHLEGGSDDYDLLSTTESPEFSFSGSTVFEALSEVLSSVDALPRFEGDGTGEGGFKLTLDYYNKTGSEIDASTKFTAYTSNGTEQKFDNSMVTNFQNAEMVTHFPGKPLEGSPKYARARVSSYGIPELSDYVLAVDKPIKFINRLWLRSYCAYNAVFDSGKTYSWGEFKPTLAMISNIPFPVDVASFVFDETTYSSALAQGGQYSDKSNHNIRIQYNCLKFKKGGMAIQCGNKATNAYNNVYGVLWNCWQVAKDRAIGRYCLNNRVPATASDGSMPQHPNFIMSFCDEWKFKDVWFSCEYGTDASGRLEVESPFAKKDGEARVSSSSASVDIGKLGLNMLGVALRSGEPTMTCGQAISSWDNRIRVGQVLWLPDQTGASGTSEKWVATKASYATLDADGGVDAIKGTIQFTKNFNGLSKRIALDQSKRLWNIDRGISDLCEVNVMTYVYAEMAGCNKTSFDDNSDGDMPISEGVLGGLFMKALSPKTSTHTDISYATLSSSGSNKEVYIPLNVYGSGNCVCFEAKMGDPISAGVKMTASADGETYWWATDTWQKAVGNTYYYGTDVKYADDEGYAETFSVTYYNADDLAVSENFPEVEWDGGKPSSKFAITGIEFDKQPNEIFGLNYEIAFLSKNHRKNNEVFFSKRFFDSFTASKKSTLTGLLFYYSTSEDDYYSQADTKGKGSVLNVTAGVGNSDTAFWIAFTADLLPAESKSVTMKAIAICDQNGNILVSANASASARWEKGKAIYLPRLHFFARKERI